MPKQDDAPSLPNVWHTRGMFGPSQLLLCQLLIALTAGAQLAPGTVAPASSATSTNLPAGSVSTQETLEPPSAQTLPAPEPVSPFFSLTNALGRAAASVQPGSPGSLTPNVGPALAGTSQLASPAAQFSSAPAGQALLHWGPIQLRPHLDYQVSYGNSLQFAPGQQANTVINQVSPGIGIQLGDHWTLDYTPTLHFYSSSQFQDGTDHVVALSGGTTYQDWTFGLSQSYAATSQPLVETGAQTDQEVYSTLLSAAWQMNSKLSLDLSVNQNFLFVGQTTATEALSDLRQWSTMNWLNYQFAPHFTAGLGVSAGYDDVGLGSDDVFEDLQGRINWQAGSKFSVLLSAGLDYRQFLDSNVSDLLTPIYSLALQYQLFEPTALFLGGSRSISPSYYGGATSEITSINAGMRQRLLQRLFLSVTGGYSISTFQTSSTTLPGAPASDYSSTTLNVSLSTSFLTRGMASVFYAVNFFSSGAAIYDYTTTQIGLELAYRF